MGDCRMGTILMVIITVAFFSHSSLQEENPIEEWEVEDLPNDKYESEVRGWWGGGKRCCRRLDNKLREAKEDISENTEWISSTCNALGTTTDTVALSVSDFNLFRQQMIIAINLLDQSIRDIVAGTPPNCP